MALALPMNALAAVTLLGCVPVHAGAVGTVEVRSIMAHDHGSDQPDGAHQDSLGGHGPEADQEPRGEADAGDHHGAYSAKPKCSSCAPCCAVAAAAPESPRPPLA
jgi:hypothetical protein